jgi:Flp pilus assembly protein TadG
MTRSFRAVQPPLRAALQRCGRFARRDDGAITIFACFMIMIMFMVCGIGADLMRHEMERTRIQSVADRAVLAASDLDQLATPEEVVRDYFAKSGMSDFVSKVTVNEGLNYRNVQVTAVTDLKTQFMERMGVPVLRVGALSKAEEKISKVEISMVLDISGSMESNNKMANLQSAAGVFLDTVLRPENRDLISVSVVPYSEHVNVGPLIASRLRVDNVHQFGGSAPWYGAPSGVNCLEMPDSLFNTVVLDKNRLYEQAQHYQWNSATSDTVVDTVCPQYEYERIIPFSQNKAYLKQQVNKFRPRAGTSIFMGLKWGAMMLDPSFRSLTTSMAGAGSVDGVFSVRPAPYSDIETLKTVILMTDGQNDRSFRIASGYYANSSHSKHWAETNFQWYLNRYVSSWQRSSWYWQKYTADQGDGLLNSVCNAAKAQGIVIWSIGFEVTDHGADVMRRCASSPTHFFRVEGVQISKAFEAIARQINQLRLTQ